MAVRFVFLCKKRIIVSQKGRKKMVFGACSLNFGMESADSIV